MSENPEATQGPYMPPRRPAPVHAEPVAPIAPAPLSPEAPAPIAPEVAPADEPKTPADLVAIVKGIRVIEWLSIRRRLEMDAVEVMEDSVACALVCAVTKDAEEVGMPRWDKFEGMTLTELYDFLGVEVVEDEAGEEAPKSLDRPENPRPVPA